MAIETLTAFKTRSCTYVGVANWPETLRPPNAVDNVTPDTMNGYIGIINGGLFSSTSNFQIFIEFDTSEFIGLSTTLRLQAITPIAPPPSGEHEENLIFVAGVNLYPDGEPLVYWPEVIRDDFNYHVQEISGPGGLDHTSPNEIVLGAATRFCIGGWNVVTEVEPPWISEGVSYLYGSWYTVPLSDFTLEFEVPVKKGNVLFNAFSL